jgi:hypothetical protein
MYFLSIYLLLELGNKKATEATSLICRNTFYQKNVGSSATLAISCFIQITENQKFIADMNIQTVLKRAI